MGTKIWLGMGATFSTGANWVGGVAPTTSDDCIFDGSGGGSSSAACTLTADYTVGSIDFTGYTGTFTHNAAVNLIVNGSGATPVVKLASGMTYAKGNSATSILKLTPGAGVTITVTTIGTSTRKWAGVTIDDGAAAGTVALADDLLVTESATGSSITLTQGTFNASNKNVSCGIFLSSNSNTRAITFGSGTWTLGQTNGTAWSMGTSTGATLTPGTAIIRLATGINLKTFAGGGATGGYPTLDLVASSNVAITGANTFAAITLAPSCNIQFPSSTNTTITAAPSWLGTSSNQISLSASSLGIAATVVLSAAGGAINWAAIRDITFTTNQPTVHDSFNLQDNTGPTISPPGGTGTSLTAGGAIVIGG